MPTYSHNTYRIPWVPEGFFFLLFDAKIERRSHDRDKREKNSPQTTGKQTLWYPEYIQDRLVYLFKSLRTTNARYGLT